MLDWEWFTDPNTAHFFHFCILYANIEQKVWRGITIERGSFVSTLANMCKRTGLTIQQTRTAISHLKSTHEITCEATNAYTKITVCNYEKYQLNIRESNKATNKRINRQSTNEQHGEQQTINTYINEKLRLTSKRQYTCQPKGKKELRAIIIDRIKNEGNECGLNDIDTSKITDMSYLFYENVFEYFNGDISMWDVSNVKIMDGMFWGCEQFNCDISNWNVSNVEDMRWMFYDCEKFNQDLNSWNVSNVEDMWYAFKNCPTQPDWYDKDKCEQ